MLSLREQYNKKYAEGISYPCDGSVRLVRNVSDLLKPRAEILDLGSGEGKRHTLYLARLGFRVTAVDFSETAIDNLKRTADEEELPLEAICASVTDPKILAHLDRYDAVLAIRLFRHFPKRDKRFILDYMQERTVVGGYNVISALVSGNKTDHKKLRSDGLYPSKKGKIEARYEDWKILKRFHQMGGLRYQRRAKSLPRVQVRSPVQIVAKKKK